MAKRKKMSSVGSKTLFKATANRTNSKNISGARNMMRGGFHF